MLIIPFAMVPEVIGMLKLPPTLVEDLVFLLCNVSVSAIVEFLPFE